MAATRIFIWALCLVGLAKAQSDTGIFYLGSDGVYNGVDLFLSRQYDNARVTMCYNGQYIYLAEGMLGANSEVRVLRIPADNTDVNFVPEEMVTIDAVSYVSIDCCCRMLAYGYQRVGEPYTITLTSMDEMSITRDFFVPDEGYQPIASLNVLCESDLIRLSTSGSIHEFSISTPGSSPIMTYVHNTLDEPPRCSGYWSDGVEEYLFTSYDDRSEIEYHRLGDTAVSTTQFVTALGSNLKTSCITIIGDDLLSFSRVSLDDGGSLIRIPVIDFINTGDNINAADYTLVDLGTTSVEDFTNGIAQCTDCENLPCITMATAVCEACNEPNFEMCGFCSPDLTECICSQPEEAGCEYSDPELAGQCSRPTEKLDAYCVVLNPVASRRTGGPVGVAVAVGDAALADGYESETFSRAAQTGRYATLLPESVPITRGFLAAVPAKARGRRFGFFEAGIVRTDGLEEKLYCLATESSAFTNVEFTYVTYEGADVQLVASMQNIGFLDQVGWSYTNLDTGVEEDLDNRASLTLDITGAQKALHEGLYQAFRTKRRLKSWHPFMYLYVRACPPDMYGNDCQFACLDCGNGICDEETGSCRCYPGFTGVDCLTPCGTPNLIGQNCDIECSNMFANGGDDCLNVEICGAKDLGCNCRSGLKLPLCIDECDDGTWGPNCRESCNDCLAGQICDKRIGCV